MNIDAYNESTWERSPNSWEPSFCSDCGRSLPWGTRWWECPCRHGRPRSVEVPCPTCDGLHNAGDGACDGPGVRVKLLEREGV